MRLLFFILFICIIAANLNTSCSSPKKDSFCDTTCNNDSLKFTNDHPEKPFVYISIKNCKPDTLVWSHNRLYNNRVNGFYDLVGKDVRLNKNFVSCYIKDTSYAWLKFNDCITGRGFLVKLPYTKTDKWSIYTSALNSFDPKFKVEEGMIAYYDDTFIYAQDMESGKFDRMTIGDKKLDPDYNNVHDLFDSINVSKSRIWINAKINGELKAKEKAMKLTE